jgi:hypothetical protein
VIAAGRACGTGSNGQTQDRFHPCARHCVNL